MPSDGEQDEGQVIDEGGGEAGDSVGDMKNLSAADETRGALRRSPSGVRGTSAGTLEIQKERAAGPKVLDDSTARRPQMQK